MEREIEPSILGNESADQRDRIGSDRRERRDDVEPDFASTPQLTKVMPAAATYYSAPHFSGRSRSRSRSPRSRSGRRDDLIREKCGETSFVEILETRDGRSKGSAIVQFKTNADVRKCVETPMEMDGRELKCQEIRDPQAFFRKIKEETGKDFLSGSSERGGGGGGGGSGFRADRGGRGRDSRTLASGTYDTYGLSPDFLHRLGIDGPLCNRVFVANLAYNVQSGKIFDIFSMAGRVTWVDMQVDKEGKNKGLCVVEYTHPLEAVQAVSMFDKQILYDRRLGVKMDKFEADHIRPRPGQLPEGLRSVGAGLGAGGEPLTNIDAMVGSGGGGGFGGGNYNAMPMQQPMQQHMQPQMAPQAPMGGGGGYMGGGNDSYRGVAPPMDNTRGFGQPTGSYGGGGAMGGAPPPQQPNMAYGQQQNMMPQQYAGTMGGAAGGFGQPNQPQQAMAQTGGYDARMAGPPQGAAPGGGQGAFMDRSVPVGGSGPAPTRTLIIRNLPTDYTWQMVKERLSRMGDVEFCDMVQAGVARVSFRNVATAERVNAALQGSIVEGRQIVVVYD